MKEICDNCRKEVDYEEKYVTSCVRIDDDQCIPVEVRCMCCPECLEGYIISEDMHLLTRMQKTLRRGKYKLLHWDDIVTFQNLVGWSDEYLSNFVNRPLPISVRVMDDEPLELEYDKKLRDEMEKHGYKPKWDKIEL